MTCLIAIDQGTTSTRAIVFDAALTPLTIAQQEFTQYFPADGQVEHDPEEIWASVLATVRAAMTQVGVTAAQVAAIGITNQRETTVVWDRATGKPIHSAIVWQEPRTPPRGEPRGGGGPRARKADPQRHRVAGPPHRRPLRVAARGRS